MNEILKVFPQSNKIFKGSECVTYIELLPFKFVHFVFILCFVSFTFIDVGSKRKSNTFIKLALAEVISLREEQDYYKSHSNIQGFPKFFHFLLLVFVN